MDVNLGDEETDRLAHAVAALTGETLADAVRTALAERLVRERMRQGGTSRSGLADELERLGLECAALPDRDRRTPEEIIGYDETGMWL